MKIKRNLKSGFFTLLPIVVFVFILEWLFKSTIKISNIVLLFFPKNWITGADGSVHIYWNIIAIILLFLVIIVIGYFSNHYYIGQKIKKIGQPIIKNIPGLNTLFRITKQVGNTLGSNKSFKKVVLVEFPNAGKYSVGFIMQENITSFEKALGSEMVSVFVPTTPNPTNGFILLVKKEEVIEVDTTIQTAVEYVISMGTTKI